ncbi:MAG: DNA double-strand break repair nuclease NurA, partial [Chloroflexota bacterium]
MSLDFQQLTDSLSQMAQAAAGRTLTRETLLDEVEVFMRNNANAWDALEDAYQFIDKEILQATNYRPYHGARLLTPGISAVNAAIYSESADLPPKATIVSVDGSQILPDRHAPYIYYLINTGGIVYQHGSAVAPEVFTTPELIFPDADEIDVGRFSSPTSVSIERDQAEIGELARRTVANRQGEGPLLAIMDQRLLYVPAGELAPQFKEKVLKEWQREMSTIRQAGGWLVGYVDRPAKSSVVGMLRTIHPEWSADEPDNLGNWNGLTDAQLFARLLEPGQRSIVFADVSHANTRFKKAGKYNEICFFYLNSAQTGINIARVDLPMWVAQDDGAVNTVHALVLDQCKILGRYPYVLTRADDMAVVGKQDQAELEFRIARFMDRQGLG